jgi:hypothetical protein
MRLLRITTIGLSTTILVSTASAQTTYTNPVDGKTYPTGGGLKDYYPAVPRDQSKQRVKNDGVLLLTSETAIAARTTAQDIVAFIKLAEQQALKVLGENKDAAVVTVQFNCQPRLCSVLLASEGKASREILESLRKALSALKPFPTTGEVIFQVTFKVDA